MSRKSILKEVDGELDRQDDKWGEQNWPWAGPESPTIDTPMKSWFQRGIIQSQADAKRLVDFCANSGDLGYCDILMEEVIEALDESNLAKVRQELIQVAAVAVAAVESLDRNGR